MDTFDLSGKTVFLTGSAGFLGEYFVKALLGAGARVVAADVAKKEYDNPNVLSLAVDVTDEDSVAQGFEEAVKVFGQIDVVVNNAAIDPKFEKNSNQNSALFEQYPLDVLKKSVEVNLIGYTIMAKAAVNYMLKNGQGNIINISSIYGLVGPDQSMYPQGTQKPVDYAITKGGVVMLTKWLATTYGNRGIRSNTLTFGGVLRGHDQAFQDAYGLRNPMGRMMNLEEVGGPLVFLASDASSYMTGSDLVVDGGWTAW